MSRPFAQVDVFGATPGAGNPVAVVLDAAGLSDDAMQAFANWTNLSETTFVLPPVAAEADYRVRIFTPDRELPFAGHPTLGTCHAVGVAGDTAVQECAAGLVPLRRIDGRWAFAAPPLLRSGPAAEELVVELARVLGLERSEIVAAQWVDNGPNWVAVLLEDASRALSLAPLPTDLDIGVVAPRDDDALEVRAFFPANGVVWEDPVTGSLNAGVAQWLLGTGRVAAPYVARQGTALGRVGRVHVSQDADGIWIGGDTATLVSGSVVL